MLLEDARDVEQINRFLSSEQRDQKDLLRQTRIVAQRSMFRRSIRWSHIGDDTDLWILVRETPTRSKVYCRNNGSQTWDEATVKEDEIGILPNDKLLQCALAEYLVDDELWQGMSYNDRTDYNKFVETLNERTLF